MSTSLIFRADDPPTEGGMTVATAMGRAHAINFQPTGGGKAAITGDFLVTGDEVNPLIRALRTGTIEVTANHSHMLDEQPRLFFIHFWANDDAQKLAHGATPPWKRPRSRKFNDRN